MIAPPPLVVDGRIVAAAQEERFSRIKHDPAFPGQAIALLPSRGEPHRRRTGLRRLLRQAPHQVRTAPRDLPRLRPRRVSAASAWPCPYGSRTSCTCGGPSATPSGSRRVARLVFADHHETHAASAFFPSPFRTGGDRDPGRRRRMEHGHLRQSAKGTRIRLIDHIAFPHSLGLLYSAFTYYCGFKVNSGEYKLMGLAPYGRPIYKDLILERSDRSEARRQLLARHGLFPVLPGTDHDGQAVHELFGGPPRRPSLRSSSGTWTWPPASRRSPKRPCSGSAGTFSEQTGMRHLVLAGGVALNCVANGRLLARGRFRRSLDSARGGRCRRGARGGPVRLASAPGKASRADRSGQPAGQLPRSLATAPTRSPGSWRGRGGRASGSRANPSCSSTSPGSWPTARSWAGSRGGWSSARGPSGPGAFWATPAPRRCRPP